MPSLRQRLLPRLADLERDWLGGDSSAHGLVERIEVDPWSAWCSRCGTTLGPGERRGPCLSCDGRRMSIARVVRLAELAGVWRSLLHQVKYGCDPLAAEALGRRLAKQHRLARGAVDRADLVVVPMPAAPLRRWHRGIDVVGEIAAAMARSLSLPMTRPLRHRGGPPRSGQSKRARTRRRLAIRPGWRATDLAGLRVLLVDDVLTTGTTIREASRLLRSLGADAIEAAVVAVTPVAGRNADRKMST